MSLLILAANIIVIVRTRHNLWLVLAVFYQHSQHWFKVGKCKLKLSKILIFEKSKWQPTKLKLKTDKHLLNGFGAPAGRQNPANRKRWMGLMAAIIWQSCIGTSRRRRWGWWWAGWRGPTRPSSGRAARRASPRSSTWRPSARCGSWWRILQFKWGQIRIVVTRQTAAAPGQMEAGPGSLLLAIWEQWPWSSADM